ncbi:UNVERIFIED_CONTAM: hypothetical protein K2H54_002983 [Gekko kuhli]
MPKGAFSTTRVGRACEARRVSRANTRLPPLGVGLGPCAAGQGPLMNGQGQEEPLVNLGERGGSRVLHQLGLQCLWNQQRRLMDLQLPLLGGQRLLQSPWLLWPYGELQLMLKALGSLCCRSRDCSCYRKWAGKVIERLTSFPKVLVPLWLPSVSRTVPEPVPEQGLSLGVALARFWWD